MSKITKVSKSDDWFSISLEDSTGFGLDAKYGVEPKVGDDIILHIVQGSTIRGITLNGKEVFYKSDEQLEKERLEWLSNHEKEKQKAFKKSKSRMDADYNALPDSFKLRIDKFRTTNPRFRIDYESYELFCCKEAVVIAETLKTKEAIQEFAKVEYEQQKELVPKLSDGHSGNTFGMACRLAYWYLSEPKNVIDEHGALATLVGCKEYGCPHE